MSPWAGVRIVAVRPVNHTVALLDSAPSLVLWDGAGDLAIVRPLGNKGEVKPFLQYLTKIKEVTWSNVFN